MFRTVSGYWQAANSPGDDARTAPRGQRSRWLPVRRSDGEPATDADGPLGEAYTVQVAPPDGRFARWSLLWLNSAGGATAVGTAASPGEGDTTVRRRSVDRSALLLAAVMSNC